MADVELLLSNPISQSVSLVKLWSEGDVGRKQDLQRALFPKGAAYSTSHFGWFCTRNPMLIEALAGLGTHPY